MFSGTRQFFTFSNCKTKETGNFLFASGLCAPFSKFRNLKLFEAYPENTLDYEDVNRRTIEVLQLTRIFKASYRLKVHNALLKLTSSIIYSLKYWFFMCASKNIFS